MRRTCGAERYEARGGDGASAAPSKEESSAKKISEWKSALTGVGCGKAGLVERIALSLQQDFVKPALPLSGLP